MVFVKRGGSAFSLNEFLQFVQKDTSPVLSVKNICVSITCTVE